MVDGCPVAVAVAMVVSVAAVLAVAAVVAVATVAAKAAVAETLVAERSGLGGGKGDQSNTGCDYSAQ